MSHARLDARKPPGFRRGVSALTALLAITGCGLVASARAGAVPVPASQALVVLLRDHVARSAPDRGAHRIESVSALRPLTRVRTVLPVIGFSRGNGASAWLHVQLPGRPSGLTGWIQANHSRRTSTLWYLSVRLSTRLVTVYHDGRVARRFRSVVGKPSTPTPRGHFFIEEAVALSPHDAGGPFALATSARSSVLQEFDGGPGQVALHGTNDLAGALGTAVSHGCVRLSAQAITWLARRIGSGVPLTITQ